MNAFDTKLADFERMCAALRFDCVSLGLQTDMTVKPAWEHEAYTVTLARGDASYSTTYRQGTGHTHAPTVSQVVSCLLSDASAGDGGDFESFCSEFGYDTDSRAAERCYNACRDCSSAMRAMLGDDFEAFQRAANEAGL